MHMYLHTTFNFSAVRNTRMLEFFCNVDPAGGGTAPCYLAPTIAHYLVYGSDRFQPRIDDIPHPDIKGKVQRVCMPYIYI